MIAAPQPMGPFGEEEEDAGGWISCSRGCSNQVEIKKGRVDVLNYFLPSGELPWNKDASNSRKHFKLSSYFSHLCCLPVYNFPVHAVNTDY